MIVVVVDHVPTWDMLLKQALGNLACTTSRQVMDGSGPDTVRAKECTDMHAVNPLKDVTSK